MASIFQVLLLAASVTPALGFCGGRTHLDKRAEGEVPISKFGYFGTAGPLLWNNLDTANTLCNTGTNQSPINMVPEVFNVTAAAEVDLVLPTVLAEGAVFENLGTTVEVVMEGLGGKLNLEGTEFELLQFHFHHPSEHIDNGVQLPMEMHMVFRSAEARVAVIGLYVDLVDSPATVATSILPRACSTALLETIFASVGNIGAPGTSTQTAPLDFTELNQIISAGSFQRYSGSLTTPPCSEEVSWMVSTQKLQISRSTFQTARDIVGFNARYPQNAPGLPNLLEPAAAAEPVVGLPASEAPAAAPVTAPVAHVAAPVVEPVAAPAEHVAAPIPSAVQVTEHGVVA